MATTLTYGRKVPATGERGTWWTNLTDNIALDDAHDHDGTDSAPIATKNLSKGTSSISSASWAAVAGQAGTYSQTITLPSGYSMSSIAMKFLIDGGDEDGAEVFLSWIKASATTYTVYINDNTLDLTAIYA